MSFDCNAQFDDPFTQLYPLIYIVPTMAMNAAVTHIVRQSNKFNHIFYRLFCVFSFSTVLRTLAASAMVSLQTLQFSCEYLWPTLLVHNRLHLIITVPESFFFFTSHFALIALTLNRLTAVFSPLRSRTFWNDHEVKLWILLIGLALILTVPFTLKYTMEKQHAHRFQSDIEFEQFTVQAFIDIFCALLTIVFAISVIYVSYSNKETVQFANERKVLYLAVAVSTLTAFILAFIKIMFLLGRNEGNKWARTVSRSYYITFAGDFASMAPVWLLLVFDRTARKQIWKLMHC